MHEPDRGLALRVAAELGNPIDKAILLVVSSERYAQLRDLVRKLGGETRRMARESFSNRQGWPDDPNVTRCQSSQRGAATLSLCIIPPTPGTWHHRNAP